ncbi:MAG: ABC transporter permease [Gemmatimonadaceae bacterium]|nr:ABC transporter permease [Gemmatimonadaceae bacterium]
MSAARSLLATRRARVALVVLIAIAAASYAGPLVYTVDPVRMDLALSGAPPSALHPLGADESGRDVLGRLLAGGRVSLAVGLLAMLVALTVGGTVGAIAGYRGGWVDQVLMRFTDSALAIPVLFVVIAVLTFLGPSVPTLVLAIGATSWMGAARVVRGELLVLREQPFVEAARALGCRPGPILVRHLLPHLVPTLLVASAIGVATAILMESTLSFLGLGVQPPAASWGNMLSGAQSYLFTYPRLAIAPGVMILMTVVAVNVLADALAPRRET